MTGHIWLMLTITALGIASHKTTSTDFRCSQFLASFDTAATETNILRLKPTEETLSDRMD